MIRLAATLPSVVGVLTMVFLIISLLGDNTRAARLVEYIVSTIETLSSSVRTRVGNPESA